VQRLVIALVTLISLTAAAVVAGYLLIFSAGADRAARLAPADTAFYVNVYLQPSTGQQMNLSGLIGRLPGFADEASLDDKVDQIVQNLLSGSGIDYRRQVKPWLGNQVAIAGSPAADDPTQTSTLVIAEVKDPEAARNAVEDLADERGASFNTETYGGVELQVGSDATYAFVDEMLVVGTTPDEVRAAIDAAGDGDSLADRADFRSAMDSLPADHLAAAFVDVGAFADSAGVSEEAPDVGAASAVLVAEQDGLRVSGSVPLNGPSDDSSPAASTAASEASELVEWMAPDTLAEVVLFGLRQTLEDAEAAVGSAPGAEDVASALDTIRFAAAFGLGIDIDADLLPLLDREVALAITGVEDGVPSGALLLRPEDPDAASAVLGQVADRLGALGGSSSETDVAGATVTTLAIPDVGDISYAVVDGTVILGLQPDAVGAIIAVHESGDSLATSDAYRRIFEAAGTHAGNELYVDVGALVDLMGDAAELPDDARDILLQIGSFGLTAPANDDRIEFHAVLTVDEASDR
jgi:hypothetical protein